MSKSVKLVKLVSPIALAITLSACGGGSSGADFGSNSNSGSGANPGDGSVTPGDNNGGNGGTDVPSQAASSLSLTASSRQLFSEGNEPVILSVVAKDINNNVLSDAVVNFQVDSDANIIVNPSSGAVKTAELTPGPKDNRTLTVKAISGSQVETILVDVVGTELQIEGPSSIAINKPTEYTVQLLDSGAKAIAFEDVTVESALGNTITPASGTSFRTDSNGEFSVNIEGLAGGLDTITATALGTSATQEIEISGNDFTLASANSDITIETSETITLVWLQDGNPQANETISLRSTRGILPVSTVTTNANGEASFTISSSTAGTATVTAETSTGLTTTLEREFVATTPAFLNTQASPTLVGQNKNSTIITKVRDINDNPIKDIKVNFNLTDTVSYLPSWR